MLTVLLVDDHVALREGLEVLLERRGMQVAAAVDSALDAIEAVGEHEPDIAVVDLQLPDQSGIRLVQRIRIEHPGVKVLIYTGSEDRETLADALGTGAEGIVLKPAGLGPLVDALRAVARGDRHVDPAVAAILDVAEGEERLLTKREREVFALLAQGLSGEEIATQLVLSAETVRTHIRNGMGRLQARTRTEAVVQALERGEIESDQR